jgi:hypothetical protein
LSALAAAAVLAAPSPARADWRLGAYLGASKTMTNTLTVTPATGAPSTITDVKYKGEPFRSPQYYGFRAAWLPGEQGLGLEVEYWHDKAIATSLAPTAELSHFQQSHGLNLLLANVAYRLPPSCGGGCTIALRVGAGISRPHVETTFRGEHQEQYQYGGVAYQAGIGVEQRLWHGLYGLADAKWSRVSEGDLRGAGVSIDGTFTGVHVDFGLGWRFP